MRWLLRHRYTSPSPDWSSTAVPAAQPRMSPEVSVVVPVCNEADNVIPLAQEIVAALRGRLPFEMIFVDDGSSDATAQRIREARTSGLSEMRLLRHSGRSGQSAAVHSGVRAARAQWIATLDGDGQNDPADLPKLIAARGDATNEGVMLFMGNRVTRRDTWLRRLSSRIANGVRAGLLGDGTPDTGCGIKLFHRETFLSLPAFDHMHRFLPALFQRAGSRVTSVPVNHRERTRGRSKYGVHNRLWVGIVDLFGVMWLKARSRPGVRVVEE
jgi:glycosyltransferase involved in cell wall biosynthesis